MKYCIYPKVGFYDNKMAANYNLNMDFHVYGQWKRVAYPAVLFSFFLCFLKKEAHPFGLIQTV